MTRLPASVEWTLAKSTVEEAAEIIERHIDFVDKDGRSVRLPTEHVRHFMRRRDSKMPRCYGFATMPFVMKDGRLMSGDYLHRELGISFRVPPEVDAILPRPEDCHATAVATAMRFLTDEWLVDVGTDYTGKCILVAFALTIIERLVLPERPAFFVTAGQRGSGKTTTCHMVTMAAVGRMASAYAWSTSAEERRKALFAFMGAAVDLVFWDNIPRGLTLSCPSIEKALTSYMYTDRVLGATEERTVPATTVQAFTGNNISPKGDLASRSLICRLGADRPDPENRRFRHTEPIAWTNNNRAEVLQALYTILLGNPRLRGRDRSPEQTRFKVWWHLVGAAVENAAREHTDHTHALALDPNPTCRATPVSFRKLFLDSEADEEQSSSLATVLETLHTKWPGGFKAIDVAAYCGQATEQAIEFKAALEQAAGKAIVVITATTVSWRLKAVLDAPVSTDGGTLVLRRVKGHDGDAFRVERRT